jgi:hypothetical protein
MARRRILLAAVVAVLFAGLAAGLVSRVDAGSAHPGPTAEAAAAPSNRADAARPVTPAFRTADARPLRFSHRWGPLLAGLGLLAVLAVVVGWLVDSPPWSRRRLALGDRGRPRAPPLLV